MVRLGLNFHPMGELRGGSNAPATNFFLSRTETRLKSSADGDRARHADAEFIAAEV